MTTAYSLLPPLPVVKVSSGYAMRKMNAHRALRPPMSSFMQFAQNRLSRFVYDSSSASGTSESEEVLITTSEKESTIHSAGWVGFKPSAYAAPTVKAETGALLCFVVFYARATVVAAGGFTVLIGI